VFTFLIIPATLSAVFASGWKGRLMAAWAAGAVSSALGLLFAARFDFSVGPAIALFLGAGLITIGSLRALRVKRAAAGAAWLFVAVALGAWFATGAEIGGGNHTPPGSVGGAPQAGNFTHSHHPGDEPAGSPAPADETGMGEFDPESVAALADAGKLEALYNTATDAEQRSEVVCRLLEVDQRAGVRMALSFLRDDPPLLFGATVVDKLEEVTGADVPYDIDQPYASPANQRAAAGLRALAGLDRNENH
jgi:hypothetical protein